MGFDGRAGPGVIFDLDGTLLDTLEDLSDSMNAALAAEGLPTHPVAAYRHFVGDGIHALARRVVPAGRREDDALAGRLAEGMRTEYARRWDAKTRPYDGVPELLDELTRRGVRRAVLSNKPHDFTLLCVGKLLGDRDFDAVQGVSDAVPVKPDPTGALVVAETLEAAPERVLYVGDTNTDMLTARAAGMFAVGVLWGFRDAEELRSSGADELIEHPTDLVPLLARRPPR